MKALTHLLDTNILSDLIRYPQGVIAKKIRERGEKTVCTSLIVAAEIRYGCAKKQSVKLTAQANAILEALTILPLSLRSMKYTAKSVIHSKPRERRSDPTTYSLQLTPSVIISQSSPLTKPNFPEFPNSELRIG